MLSFEARVETQDIKSSAKTFCFIPGHREAVVMTVSWRRRLHSGELASYLRPSRANPLDCGNSSTLPKVTSVPGIERRPVTDQKKKI
ncbi:uncharacterized [Tachysurus ichikawai]